MADLLIELKMLYKHCYYYGFFIDFVVVTVKGE